MAGDRLSWARPATLPYIREFTESWGGSKTKESDRQRYAPGGDSGGRAEHGARRSRAGAHAAWNGKGADERAESRRSAHRGSAVGKRWIVHTISRLVHTLWTTHTRASLTTPIHIRYGPEVRRVGRPRRSYSDPDAACISASHAAADRANLRTALSRVFATHARTSFPQSHPHAAHHRRTPRGINSPSPPSSGRAFRASPPSRPCERGARHCSSRPPA